MIFLSGWHAATPGFAKCNIILQTESPQRGMNFSAKIISSLRDCHGKRPEGPKYFSPRCQPWVEREIAKMPEAQDAFKEVSVFASGMETDDLIVTTIDNARHRSNFHEQAYVNIQRVRSEFYSRP
jgi:hypothetical protein